MLAEHKALQRFRLHIERILGGRALFIAHAAVIHAALAVALRIGVDLGNRAADHHIRVNAAAQEHACTRIDLRAVLLVKGALDAVIARRRDLHDHVAAAAAASAVAVAVIVHHVGALIRTARLLQILDRAVDRRRDKRIVQRALQLGQVDVLRLDVILCFGNLAFSLQNVLRAGQCCIAGRGLSFPLKLLNFILVGFNFVLHALDFELRAVNVDLDLLNIIGQELVALFDAVAVLHKNLTDGFLGIILHIDRFL